MVKPSSKGDAAVAMIPVAVKGAVATHFWSFASKEMLSLIKPNSATPKSPLFSTIRRYSRSVNPVNVPLTFGGAVEIAFY